MFSKAHFFKTWDSVREVSENNVGKEEKDGWPEKADKPALKVPPSKGHAETQAQPIFFPSIDDSHSTLTAFHCFDNGYVGKQLVAWKEYCVENWWKELQESVDRCTGRSDITEILVKRH